MAQILLLPPGANRIKGTIMRIICLTLPAAIAAATIFGGPASAATETVLHSFETYAKGFPDGDLHGRDRV